MAGVFLPIGGNNKHRVCRDILRAGILVYIPNMVDGAANGIHQRSAAADGIISCRHPRHCFQVNTVMKHTDLMVKEHCGYIHAMLQSGEKEAAQQYVAEPEKTATVRSLLSDCQNAAVDAFLRERTENLAAQGVTLSVDIHLPPYCFVSDVDLITALGNLLDNAADACQQIPHSYIALKASLSDGFLHIETENPYRPNGSKKERRISYMERGTGISILKSLAEKYNGSFVSHENDGIYNTLIFKEPLPHD